MVFFFLVWGFSLVGNEVAVGAWSWETHSEMAWRKKETTKGRVCRVEVGLKTNPE